MTIPRWRLALTAGALVVLGAAASGFVQAAATPPTPVATSNADGTASTSDTAVLLDTLALMTDPTSSGAAMPAQLLALRDRVGTRLANVRGHLVHGSLTVFDRDGKLVTWQLDHGTVSATGSASITIAESGGSKVTVSTSSATRVRKDAKPSTLTDIEAGDEVVVRSTVVNGAATANLVVVLPPKTTTTPSNGANG
jgi:hypothetical protein